jgi:hypothetical protein
MTLKTRRDIPSGTGVASVAYYAAGFPGAAGIPSAALQALPAFLAAWQHSRQSKHSWFLAFPTLPTASH